MAAIGTRASKKNLVGSAVECNVQSEGARTKTQDTSTGL